MHCRTQKLSVLLALCLSLLIACDDGQDQNATIKAIDMLPIVPRLDQATAILSQDQGIKDIGTQLDMIINLNLDQAVPQDQAIIMDRGLEQDQMLYIDQGIQPDQAFMADQSIAQDQMLLTDQSIQQDQMLNQDMQLSSCMEDRFFPNQALAQASVLTEGLFDQLLLCEGIEDWYRLEVCAQGAVLAEVQFDHALGDLDIELYDENQNLVDQGATLTSNELVLYESAQNQSMYLKIKGKDAQQSNRYRINYFTSLCRACQRQSDCPIDTVCDQGLCELGGCVDDMQEENDQINTASPLLSTQNDLQICAQDEDWYKIELCAGADLIVVAHFNQLLANLDLFLYTGTPQNLNTVDQATSLNHGDEAVVYSATTAQAVYLKVIGINQSEAAYQLEVDISPCP